MTLSLGLYVPAEHSADLAFLRRTARALDRSGGTRLVLGDDFRSGLDAVQLALWLAPQTRGIRLVPEVPLTHNEPFHLASATATLDHDSLGRAGWAPVVQTDRASAALVGRRAAAPAEEAWREAGDVLRTVRALWLSWEPDAEIRDVSTGRFLDAQKVHYVDAAGVDSVGEPFTVKGPSIVPRPPQGELPTTVVVRDQASAAAAASLADQVLVAPEHLPLLTQALADAPDRPDAPQSALLLGQAPEDGAAGLLRARDAASAEHPELSVEEVVVTARPEDAGLDALLAALQDDGAAPEGK